MSESILKGLTLTKGSGGSATAIGQIFNIGGLEALGAWVDVSDFGDTWDQALPTTKSVSDFTFDVHYDPSLHDALLDELNEFDTYTLTLANGAEFDFTGFLTRWALGGGDRSGKAVVSGTIHINGPFTN